MAKQPRPKAPRAKSAPKQTRPSRTVLIVVGVVAIAALALIGGSIALSGGDDESGGATPVAFESAIAGLPQNGTFLGNPDATVTLIEYADLQCPFCKQYAIDGFPGVVDEYVRPGDVKLEFRGLAFLGDDSRKALRFAQAAGLQNKLWDMNEALFVNQGDENSGWVTDELVRAIGEQIEGLDVDTMFADVDDPRVEAAIAKAEQQSSTAGVKGTPAFFIQIGDDPPYAIQPTSLGVEGFREALDDALGK